MQSGLESKLQEFDGVAVSILSEARAACRATAHYVDDLISLCFDPRSHISDGATWILKAEIEDGLQLPPQFMDRIVNPLNHLTSWQAKLHMCQSVDGFPFTAAQADRFIAWATSLADHSRPFLRVWSLHARVMLGLKFEKHRGAAEVALEVAKADQAASVRARARKLRKLLTQ